MISSLYQPTGAWSTCIYGHGSTASIIPHVSFGILLYSSLLGAVERSSASCVIPWVSGIEAGELEKDGTTKGWLGHHKIGNLDQSQLA